MMFDIIINICISVFNLEMFYSSFLPLQSSDVWSFSCSSIPNGILIDFVWYEKFKKKKKEKKELAFVIDCLLPECDTSFFVLA